MIKSATPKITIDTNCIIGLLDAKSETATSVDELRELIRYSLSGSIQISITSKLEDDLGRDRNENRRIEMMHGISMFPVVASVASLELNESGIVVTHTDPKQVAILHEIIRVVFPGLTKESGKIPNKLADCGHLFGHMIARRDVFVTDDKGIIRRSKELRDGFGIVVMNPSDCLNFVDGLILARQRRTLDPSVPNEAYHDRRLKGSVTFDYSNNNGRFTIGEGLYLFETRWSKASDTSIHAYHDAPSILAIALLGQNAGSSDSGDISTFDFSSRVRTPRTGQVVIWKNVNGFYAATRIVKILDNSRGAPNDSLIFDFSINLDGKVDLSDLQSIETDKFKA